MSQTIKDVKVIIELDDSKRRQINYGLKEIRENVDKTDKSFNALGSVVKKFGAGFAVTSVVAGLVGIAKAGIDAQESFSKFGTVFKSNIGEANKALRDLQQNYGQSEKAGRDLLANTGDLLSGFGFSADASLKLSSKVQKLAIDLASFTNYSGGAKGASEALTKALLGEREQIKSLGISIDEAILKERLMKEGKADLTGIALKQARAEATLQLAYEQSKNAIGDFQRTQNDTANILRRAQSAIEDIIVAIGSKFSSSIGGAGKVFLSFLDGIKEFLGLDTVSKLQAEAANVDTLIRSITSLAEGDKTRLGLLKELKKVYPELLQGIDLEKIKNEDLKNILDQVNDSYRERIKLAQQEKLVAEDRAEAAEQEYKRQKAIIELQKDLSKFTGGAEALQNLGLNKVLSILSAAGGKDPLSSIMGLTSKTSSDVKKQLNILNPKAYSYAPLLRLTNEILTATKLRDEALARITEKQKTLNKISETEAKKTQELQKETQKRFGKEEQVTSEKDKQLKLISNIKNSVSRVTADITKRKKIEAAITDIIINGTDKIEKYPDIQKEIIDILNDDKKLRKAILDAQKQQTKEAKNQQKEEEKLKKLNIRLQKQAAAETRKAQQEELKLQKAIEKGKEIARKEEEEYMKNIYAANQRKNNALKEKIINAQAKAIEQLNQWNQLVNTLAQNFSKLGSIISGKVGNAISGLGQGISDVFSGLKTIEESKKLTGALKTLSVAGGTAGIIAGVISGIQAVAPVFADIFGLGKGPDWDKLTYKILGNTDAVRENKEQIIELAKEYSKAGFNIENAIKKAFITSLPEIANSVESLQELNAVAIDVETQFYDLYNQMTKTFSSGFDRGLDLKISYTTTSDEDIDTSFAPPKILSPAEISLQLVTIGKAFTNLSKKQLEFDNTYIKSLTNIVKKTKEWGVSLSFVNDYIDAQYEYSLEAFTTLQNQAVQVDTLQKEYEDLLRKLLKTKEGTDEFKNLTIEVNKAKSALEAAKLASVVLGLEGSEAFQKIIDKQKKLAEVQPIITAISNIEKILGTLQNTADITEIDFKDFGNTAVVAFNKLLEGGLTSEEALQQIAPLLIRLIQLQEEYGWTASESLQDLIDKAKEAGISLDPLQSAQDQMLLTLLLIAKAVGVTLPDAFEKLLQSGLDALNGLSDAADDTKDAIGGITLPGEGKGSTPGVSQAFGLNELAGISNNILNNVNSNINIPTSTVNANESNVNINMTITEVATPELAARNVIKAVRNNTEGINGILSKQLQK